VTIAGYRPAAFRSNVRPFAWATAGVLTANALAGYLLLNLLFVDATSVQYGNHNMRAAAQARVREAFGDTVSIRQVQYVPSGKFVSASLGKGSLTLDWPDTGRFTASFPPYQQGVDPATAGSIPVAPQREHHGPQPMPVPSPPPTPASTSPGPCPAPPSPVTPPPTGAWDGA
jgi:hypothetical protein